MRKFITNHLLPQWIFSSPSLTKLFRVIIKNPLHVTLIFFLGLGVSIIQPLALKITQVVIDELKSFHSQERFMYLSFEILGLFFISGVLKFFHQILRRNMNERILCAYRQELYHSFLTTSETSLGAIKSGELLSVFQNDIGQLSYGLETFFDLVKEPFTIMALIVTALYYNIELSLLSFIMLPIFFSIFSIIGHNIKRYSSKNLGIISDILSLAQETLSGSKVIKLFLLEKKMKEKFHFLQNKYLTIMYRSIRVQELGTPLIELIGALIIVVILLYGSYQIASHKLTTGELISFILALGLTQVPIKKLNNAWIKLKSLEAAMDRIETTNRLLLSHPQYDIEESNELIKKAITKTDIEYKNISFHYMDGKEILNDVSFTVPQGQITALCGKSGSGKTTLVHLLLKLYQQSRGDIFIGGTNTKNISHENIQKMISFVSQDAFLFYDTLYENIRLGDYTKSRQEIEDIAHHILSRPLLQRLPEGLDTFVGERGLKLSGGERQKVSIARAFVKNAPILIMDEATSNLDPHSEQSLHASINLLMAHKTILLIAHRISSVERAHHVVLMDSGKVIEKGNFLELKENKKSAFHSLFFTL